MNPIVFGGILIDIFRSTLYKTIGCIKVVWSVLQSGQERTLYYSKVGVLPQKLKTSTKRELLVLIENIARRYLHKGTQV